MEWLGWIFGALVVVTLITLVGHGIWLVTAKLFRPRTPARLPPTLASMPDDISRTAVQVSHLLDAELIDAQTHQRVILALDTVRRRRTPPPLPVLPISGRQEPWETQLRPPIPKSASQPDLPQLTPPLAGLAPPLAVHTVPDLPAASVPQERVQARPRPAPAVPRLPRRPLSQVFAAFLRDSNIRWGELIGGLLIIGCSIALVVSFWNEIASKPFFQFGIFTGVTAAMLGLGLYAEHRWKLPTTSRGILVIATLLVPLNFLAFAALSHGRPESLSATVSELVALVVFGFLVWRAAPVLAQYWPNLFAIGVLSLSASLLIIKHLGPAHSLPMLFAIGGMPVAAYGMPIAAMLRRANRWRQVRAHAAEAMFLMLGILTFAAAAALSLVVFQGGTPRQAAHHLAPLLSIATAPALATGLLLWRRITDKRLGKFRTAGTAVGVAAALLMLEAIVLAWPDPAVMLPLAAIDFIVFITIAVLFDIPSAHVLAAPCLLMAYLLGFHLALHHMGWRATPQQMVQGLIASSGGPALLPLFLAIAAVSRLLSRHRRVVESRLYAWIAVAVGIVSLALVSRSFGRPGDTFGAAWLYLIYAAAAFTVAWRSQRQSAGWAGCLSFTAALVQFLLTRTAVTYPWATALLAYATISVAGLFILRRGPSRAAVFILPAKVTASAASAISVVLLLASLSISTIVPVSWRILWLAGLWLALAVMEESFAVFTAAQIALAAAVTLGALARIAHQSWFADSADPLLEPWTLQAVGLALAIFVLAISLARLVLPTRLTISRWLGVPGMFDRVLSMGLMIELYALVLAAIVPAVHIEYATGIARPALEPWARHSLGAGSWALLGILLCVFGLWIIGNSGRLALSLLIATAALACPLWAGKWSDAAASGSALRWSLAAFLLATTIPIWLRQRMPWLMGGISNGPAVARELMLLLTALAAVPILGLSIYPATMTLEGSHLIGPDHATFFAAIGDSMSYVVPLLIMTCVFVGNAVRERAAGWAMAASAACNLTVTLGYALALVTAGQTLDLIHFIRLIQINVLTFAAFTLAWQAARAIDQRNLKPVGSTPFWLGTEIALAMLGNLVLLVPAALWMFLSLPWARAEIAAVGDPLGWCTLIATFAAAFWLKGWNADRLSAGTIALAIISAAFMTSFASTALGNVAWGSYHVLMISMVAATGAILGIGVWIGQTRRGWAQPSLIPTAVPPPIPALPVGLEYERRDHTSSSPVPSAIYVGGEELRPAFRRWTAIASGLVLLLALRAMLGDPQRPWWSVGITATISLIWTALACWLVAPRLLYVGGLLLNLAATMWWVAKPFATSPSPMLDLASANIAVLALSGLAAMVLHLHLFNFSATGTRAGGLPFHRFAAFASLIVLVIIAETALSGDITGQPVHEAAMMTWGAIASTVVLMTAILWDAESPFVIGELYVLGLVVLSGAMHSLRLAGEQLEVGAVIALAACVILTGILSGTREGWLGFAERLGIPRRPPREATQWLAPANLVLATLAVGLAFACDLHIARLSLRVGAATATLAQVPGLILVTRGDRRRHLRELVLGVLLLAAIAWGWGWMSPANANWLDRSVVTMVAIATTILVGIVALNRFLSRQSEWSVAVRSALMPAVIACTANLLEIVALEISDQANAGSVRMHPAGIAVVLGAILVAATAAVIIALYPARDPFPIPDARRDLYIYASESLLALAFLHLRLTLPWLFSGRFSHYWPLMVMGLAFAGVALGESFRRRGTLVLSSPLFRTGIFLPLLPVLTFWLMPSKVDLSVLLFTVGAFYAILSATRRSFGFGILAALAANGGLWSLLSHQPQLRFLIHPQLWLIPAAASVLVAAQLNRDRLSPSQLRFTRYCCLMVAYVSSTADIFLNGVRDHPWLPLVLAGLAVTGVMLGFVFRLRAFLFLGTSFLGLAMITMIYYASANLHWTWLWYVAGIALGAAIIVTFALFEKKRAEMLAMVDGLRQWE